MLLQLNIMNFALIEKLSISFEEGFNVLSGETGAGKSILIDSINYVLGGKFNKDFIRTGEEKTYVEAVFSLQNKKTIEVLKTLEIEYEDTVILSRETFVSGKSIAKVNGKAMLLSNMKLVAQTLMDIHGQHENQNLLESSNHLSYLDYFAENKVKNLLQEFNNEYQRFMSINTKIKELQGNEGEKEKICDFIKYQIDEISNLNFKIGEEEELEERFSVLSNSEKIEKTLSNCYEVLYDGEENEYSVFDKIGSLVKELKTIEKYIEKIKGVTSSLEDAYYNIEQSVEVIRGIKGTIYFDEKELEYINERIYKIGLCKKKYGKTIEEILQYKIDLEKQYEEYINSKEIIEKLMVEKKKVYTVIKEKAAQIHEVRKEAAKELEGKVKFELNYIGLEKSTFQIGVEFDEQYLNSYGADKVQFFISTNPGEPLKPLEKVVSGGELSRIMLALKTVFVDKDQIPSVIFDEIDTGISGRVAQSVAEKMYLISNKHQVFCVTHLPQIACISDIHYLILKKVENGKTYTFVKKLNDVEKMEEISRMVGGAEVTKLTLEHTRELIEMANSKKIKLNRITS